MRCDPCFTSQGVALVFGATEVAFAAAKETFKKELG